MTLEVVQGDCLDVLKTLPAGSVDAVVTDPPYGIGINGEGWDSDVPPVPVWAECLRVMKPGAHLLAFASTRTQHRMAGAIEAAGFEVRDMLAWVYSNGYPKSRDVSDEMALWQSGEIPASDDGQPDPAVLRVTAFLRAARDRAGWTNRRIDELFGTHGMAGHWTTQASQPAVPSLRQWEILKDALGFGDELDGLVQALAATEKTGKTAGKRGKFLGSLGDTGGGAGAWGTGLKPALEPITMARKPMKGSTGANVARYGTGALHIGACRGDGGRWPANLLHDGGAEVLEVLGGASRFFYAPKASASDRGEGNTHPTVKPTALMRHLCRLVTPPGGLVVDPFAGSGSTGKACALEGFRFIGAEREAEFVQIARKRIAQAANDNAPLFAGGERAA